MASAAAESRLKLLGKCPLETLEQFVHRVADSWCERGTPRFQDYRRVWGIGEWQEVVDACRYMIKASIGKDKSKDETLEMLTKCEVPEEHAQLIAGVLDVRREELRPALAASAVTISRAHLQDFDWKVQLIMSSDRLANIREPVASVDFHIAGQSGSEQVSIELNREELKKMIISLESANKVVQQLKS